MTYEEAIKVAEMCRPDKFGAMYPPTNPAVLLEAARTIYLEHSNPDAVKAIVVWLLCSSLRIYDPDLWRDEFAASSWLEE